jgi:hypothetical protein
VPVAARGLGDWVSSTPPRAPHVMLVGLASPLGPYSPESGDSAAVSRPPWPSPRKVGKPRASRGCCKKAYLWVEEEPEVRCSLCTI